MQIITFPTLEQALKACYSKYPRLLCALYESNKPGKNGQISKKGEKAFPVDFKGLLGSSQLNEKNLKIRQMFKMPQNLYQTLAFENLFKGHFQWKNNDLNPVVQKKIEENPKLKFPFENDCKLNENGKVINLEEWINTFGDKPHGSTFNIDKDPELIEKKHDLPFLLPEIGDESEIAYFLTHFIVEKGSFEMIKMAFLSATKEIFAERIDNEMKHLKEYVDDYLMVRERAMKILDFDNGIFFGLLLKYLLATQTDFKIQKRFVRSLKNTIKDFDKKQESINYENEIRNSIDYNSIYYISDFKNDFEKYLTFNWLNSKKSKDLEHLKNYFVVCSKFYIFHDTIIKYLSTLPNNQNFNEKVKSIKEEIPIVEKIDKYLWKEEIETYLKEENKKLVEILNEKEITLNKDFIIDTYFVGYFQNILAAGFYESNGIHISIEEFKKKIEKPDTRRTYDPKTGFMTMTAINYDENGNEIVEEKKKN